MRLTARLNDGLSDFRVSTFMGIRTEGSVRYVREGHSASQFDHSIRQNKYPHHPGFSPEAATEFKNLVEYLTNAQVPIKLTAIRCPWPSASPMFPPGLYASGKPRP